MLPEKALRLRVLQRLADGRLPVMLSPSIYAGYGRRDSCEVCELPIEPEEVQYDVIEPSGTEGRLHFHLACHSAWQGECACRAALQTRESRPA